MFFCYKISPLCRVLHSFEPACAGVGSFSEASPWPRPIAVLAEVRTRKISVGTKPVVQHHEHRRAFFLYHDFNLLHRYFIDI